MGNSKKKKAPEPDPMHRVKAVVAVSDGGVYRKPGDVFEMTSDRVAAYGRDVEDMGAIAEPADDSPGGNGKQNDGDADKQQTGDKDKSK